MLFGMNHARHIEARRDEQNEIDAEKRREAEDAAPTVEDRLEKHGFTFEWTGGNCSAFTRSDGQVREMITLADSPEAPELLTDMVDVGTYDNDGEPITNYDIVSGYTLADILAALENPSDEYYLLSLRLHNEFHKRIAL
jgi:hypothetical protein